jgi:hypothetical protein
MCNFRKTPRLKSGKDGFITLGSLPAPERFQGRPAEAGKVEGPVVAAPVLAAHAAAGDAAVDSAGLDARHGVRGRFAGPAAARPHVAGVAGVAAPLCRRLPTTDGHPDGDAGVLGPGLIKRPVTRCGSNPRRSTPRVRCASSGRCPMACSSR